MFDSGVRTIHRHRGGVTTVTTAEPRAPAGLSIVWESPGMRAVIEAAGDIGASDAKVLIGGESGVGKDIVARYVHATSARAHCPLVTVNCAALADTLLESELFGHTRGSFTGAHRDKVGQLQRAHHGTLFLDEVGEMSPRMQAALLRFLENGEVQPVGADAPRTLVDVRVIAATNVDLDERVATGRFRSDLLYRLRVMHLVVPPLRDRREDIPVLVAHFLRNAPASIVVSEPAMRLLIDHDWPGNVRELRNVVEQAVARAHGREIGPEHLPVGFGRRAPAVRANAERRQRVADELYQGLISGECSFWDDVHPLFLMRDLTREDIRQLVRLGLGKTRGNYRALLTLFRIPQTDYKRFLNLLTTHDCNVDFRPFRDGQSEQPVRTPRILLNITRSRRPPSPS